MLSGYSSYLLSGMAALTTLAYVTGLRMIPLPPSQPLRIYILLRSILGQLCVCCFFWFLGRQLALGLYLLVGGVYQVFILSYHSHFHFIPSLRLVIAIRREAVVMVKELFTGGFLKVELSVVVAYAIVFWILHFQYSEITGEYLDALLRTVAPVALAGLIVLVGLGILWVRKTNQASIGQLFSYHNMLKLFGPFSWQVAYSFASSEREKYNRELPVLDLSVPAGTVLHDIIFIQLESVGSEMVFAEYDGAALMPNLQQLASEHLFFPKVISAKGRGGTSDVELALFTGRTHGATDAPMLDEYYDYRSSVFRALGPKGYKAFAFHGNTGAFFKRSYAYKQMGADFYDQARMGLPDAGWGAADGAVLRYAEQQLLRSEQPVVGAVILMTTHTPFNNIDAIEPKPVAGDAEGQYERYCRSLKYVDREVKGFIERYSAKRPGTVFVVYADHAARVRGQTVHSSVVHRGTRRDLVPAWIIGGEATPAFCAEVITMPDLVPIALVKAGAGVKIHSESSVCFQS